MEGAKFTFVPLKNKKTVLDDAKNVKKLDQWSLKGNLKLKFYNFNQEFHPYQKQEFVEGFFNDPTVYSTLEVYRSTWGPIGLPAKKVEYHLMQSSVTSMTFFDRLIDPKNKIVRANGDIQQCMEDKCEGFFVDDSILAMLLVEDHATYDLYTKNERNEFIFNIFKLLYLGGEWCQRDFNIQSYLDLTKDLYKEIISVERIEGSSNIRTRSAVFKVAAYQEDGVPLCPELNHIQEVVYLVVDPFKRQLAVLMNHYGGNCE